MILYLNIIIAMYNLLECSHNYFITTGSLWKYSKDEIDEIDVNDNASNSKSFEYKAKIIR